MIFFWTEIKVAHLLGVAFQYNFTFACNPYKILRQNSKKNNPNHICGFGLFFIF